MNIISRKFLSIVLIATLIFATNTFVSYGADVTDKLVNLDIIVEQDGEVVDPDQGDKINSNQPIDIEVSFQVPVIGDGVEDYVELNDEASFQIAEGFQLIGGDVSFDLEVDTTKVGTLSLTSEAGSIIMAHVSFNGNPDVFTDSGDNWSNVNVRFTKSLEYDGDNFGDEEGDHQVALLEKTFTVNVPPLPIVVSGEKTGVRTGQYIDWKVGIEAKQGEENVDLSGYVFSDDITNVGTYESGTFEVGTAEDGTDAVALTTDFLETDTELTYTFPENTIQKQYIFFRTRIKDTVFYTNGNKTITNEAVVNNGNEDVFSEEYDVDFNVTWIQKNVVSHNDETGEVIWSITANQLGATLPNAIITDDLDDRLDNVSATLQKWDSGIEDWGAEETITQNGDDFELGTIDTPVLLKITAYIDTDEYNIGHTIQTIGNTASLSWDGQGPIPGNNTNVGIGINPINKFHEDNNYDLGNHTVDWNVEVIDSDVSLDLSVMDLLVYDNSNFDVNATYEVYDQGNNLIDTITPGIISELQPSYNQRYHGNFASDDGLELKVYTLKQSGVAVADLLYVTGPSEAGIDVTTQSKNFSFTSQITNPDIYMGVSDKNIVNTASLFSGSTWINEDDDTTLYDSRMLRKDMLKRDNATDPDANKNTSRASNSEAFNYIDRTAVFRLHVNYNDIQNLQSDINRVPGEVLGDITIADSLPSGWEFVEIDADKMFLLYEATPNSNGYNTAGTEITDYSSFLEPDFNTDGIASFEFSELTGPYVILVKAKLTDDAALEYFNDNNNETDRNTLSLETENWSSSVNRWQDITIGGDILTKNLDSFEDGALKWTVEYKPYGIERVGTEIEDTLNEGIDVRLNSQGNLDLSDGNMSVHKLTLNSNGSYTEGSEITLVEGENVFYDNETRKLRFVIPETDKAYSFEYITDITGNSGLEVTNSVSLINSTADPDSVVMLYSISRSDVSVTMTRSGSIVITKVDNQDANVEGAEFTVFTQDGETVMRTGTTDSEGSLTLRGLPVGEYILKETVAPSGYNSSDVEYKVLVAKDNGTVTTSVDGKTGEESNEINIENAVTDTAGNLKVTKTVEGNANETDKEFDFTVSIEGLNDTFNYEGIGGKANGVISFTEGIAGFSLKDGEGINILNLPKESEFTITEEDYTEDGYTKESTGSTGQILVNSVATSNFVNTKIKANITLTKQDDNNKPLEGVIFTLYDENGTNPIQKEGTDITATSNSEGLVEFEDVLYGSYQIKETTTPVGYIKHSGDPITVTVGEGDNGKTLTTLPAIVINTVFRGSIELLKVDMDEEPLEGAIFMLYDSKDSKVASSTSGADGIVAFNNIPYGEYTIVETTAPDGYEFTNSETITATISEDGVKVDASPYTIYNEFIQEDETVTIKESLSPETGDMNVARFFIFLIVSSIVAMGAIEIKYKNK